MVQSVSHQGVKYRRDIDGLRAVAVSLVILFHMGSRVYGGFIGVDVFFVISGFLISSVVMSDFAAGRFSIIDFYERRIRRIFPALLAMMAATSVLAWRYYTPGELEDYARSQLAALFSVSNFLFWGQAGYFDVSSVLKPLLHTWSLAVEEQFYLVFPLLIMLVQRFFRERMKTILVGLTLLSFAGSVLMVRYDATAAYYFAPVRFWELLIGTILSQGYLPKISGKVARNLATGGGLLLIAAASHYLNERSPFPGMAALAPCLGAALVIAGGETGGSVVGTILSFRPVVFVGLISYSLYLWHWPLLAFQRSEDLLKNQHGRLDNHELDSVTKIIFLLVLVPVATASWAWVEQPFRKGRFRPGRRRLWQMASWAVGGLAAATLALIVSGGVPSRFPPAALAMAEYSEPSWVQNTRQGVCFLHGKATLADFRQDICLARHPGRKSVLILGDSHSASVYMGLARLYPDRDILQANVEACRATSTAIRAHTTICHVMNEFLFDDYLKTNRVDLVILGGIWESGEVEALGKTIALLRDRGMSVAILGPPIQYDLNLPRVISVAMRDGRPAEIEQHRDKDIQRFDQTLAGLAKSRWQVPYISEFRDLCTPDCPVYAAPGIPLVRDADHLTLEGSLLFARAIVAHHELP